MAILSKTASRQHSGWRKPCEAVFLSRTRVLAVSWERPRHRGNADLLNPSAANRSDLFNQYQKGLKKRQGPRMSVARGFARIAPDPKMAEVSRRNQPIIEDLDSLTIGSSSGHARSGFLC